MSSRPSAAPADAARVLANKECKALARALDSPTKVHEAIHSARKSIRQLRALLQLVETRLTDVARTDRALQRVGDSLSVLRDAHVVIVTAAQFAIDTDAQRWAPVVEHLTRRHDTLLEKALAQDPAFTRRRTRIQHIALQLEALPWEQLRPKDLRHGLEKGQRRVDKAAKRAARDPTPDNLHRWRRRVRKLRMQMEAVKRIAPDIASAASRSSTGKQIKALHALSNQLGDCQDLDVLHALLKRIPGLPQRRELLAQVREKATLPSLPA